MPHVKKNVIQKKQQKKPNPAIVDLPMQPDINERRELNYWCQICVWVIAIQVATYHISHVS